MMEEEFPDWGSIGEAVSSAAKEAQKIVNQSSNAVEGLKDLALDTFEAAAAKVNDSLKVMGKEVQNINVTALSEIEEVDMKVREARNKTAAFADGASEMLLKVEPIYDQVLAQLASVKKMANQILESLQQESASEALDAAMDSALDVAEQFRGAMKDLAQQLAAASNKLSMRVEIRIEEHVEQRPAKKQAPVLLEMDPAERLSEALKSPMSALKSASEQLHEVAEKTTNAVAKFTDAATEAAQQRLPGALMDNVTAILQGVHAEAETQLTPIGSIGKQIVEGLYRTGADAGLHLEGGAFQTAMSTGLLLSLAFF